MAALPPQTILCLAAVGIIALGSLGLFVVFKVIKLFDDTWMHDIKLNDLDKRVSNIAGRLFDLEGDVADLEDDE